LLKQVAADAPLMAPELGYDSVESFLKQELQLDPDLVNRVVGWLEREQPTEAVSLEEVEAAIGKHGGDRRSVQAREVQPYVVSLKRHGNCADYLEARLRRDAPEVADALERGEIKSARAAAIKAGIITPFPSLQLKDPAPTAQKLLAKMGKGWCDQLLDELEALMLED
jgi:hypothetical protein